MGLLCASISATEKDPSLPGCDPSALLPNEAIHLKNLVPGKELSDYTIEELEKTIDEYVEKALGGDKANLKARKSFLVQRFSPIESAEAITGRALIQAFGLKLYKLQHPEKDEPKRAWLFTQPGYAIKDILSAYKERAGLIEENSGAIRVKEVAMNRPRTEFSLSEIDTILAHYVNTKLSGKFASFQPSTPNFRNQLFAGETGTDAISGNTLFEEYARRRFEADHPGEKAPSGAAIFIQPGYSRPEVLRNFRQSHGHPPGVKDSKM